MHGHDEILDSWIPRFLGQWAVWKVLAGNGRTHREKGWVERERKVRGK